MSPRTIGCHTPLPLARALRVRKNPSMEYIRLLVSALVTEVVDLLGIFRRRRPPKLLVVKLDHVGDVVTATPVFRALRAAFPGATLHALVGPWARDLLAPSPFLDKVI